MPRPIILRVMTCFLLTFIANGIARFGYVVLIPILILSNALTETQSLQLGIAILLGYIFGSLVINFFKQYLSLENIAKLSLLLIAISFLVCAIDLPFALVWFFHFLAGVASASLMILAAPLSLPYVKKRAMASASGFVFSGVGFGAVLSGFILPLIAEKSLPLVWFFLFGISFMCFIFALFTLKSKNPPTKNLPKNQPFKMPFFLWLVFISYILNAIGYLPHTLFWTDYLVRSLDFSSIVAGYSWAFFGIGAALGSIGSGILASKIGLTNAHIAILILKDLSCFMAIFLLDIFWLNLSVFIMGFTTTGNVALTNSMALHIVGKGYFSTSLSVLTFGFGVFQGIFSLLFAFILPTIGYLWLFVFCGFCLIASALILVPIRERNRI